jgi:hypothetical protein
MGLAAGTQLGLYKILLFGRGAVLASYRFRAWAVHQHQR